MKESMWLVFVITFGLMAFGFTMFFQRIVTTGEHNYHMLKETTEAAMYESIDYSAYRLYGVVRIDREKFVENFVRRFAENASFAETYTIEIYDIVEIPPKVSIQVTTRELGQVNLAGGEVFNMAVINRIDGILESVITD